MLTACFFTLSHYHQLIANSL
jgi:hypothetical protein